jgi:predicted methyltransferase MtxX (methanogen marker protein 4)
LNGEAGDVVTPVGRPESVTTTESLKPFALAMEAVKVEVVDPAVAVIAGGARARLKSG